MYIPPRGRVALAFLCAVAVAVVGSVYALAAPTPPAQPTITGSPPVATSARTATFTFTDAQSVTFECSRDGAAFATCGGPATPGAKTYSGLTAGTHTFAVRARIGALTSSAAGFSWLIDVTPPSTPLLAFDALSPNAFYRGAQNVLFFRPAAGGTFRVTASSTDPESGIRPGSAGYTFSALAGNGFVASQSAGQTTYSFGLTATAPSVGPTIVATNNAGLDSAGAGYQLRADTVAPTGGALTVNGTAATSSGTSSTSTAVSFAIARTDYGETPSATRSGLAASTLKRESAPLSLAGCGAYGTASVGFPGEPDQSLLDGCYRYTLAGTDRVGNAVQLHTTVTVDTTTPVFTREFPSLGAAYGNASWTAGCGGRICGQATDPSGVVAVQLSISQVLSGRYWNGRSFATTSPTSVVASLSAPDATSTAWSYALAASAFPADGAYTIIVRGRDGLGNSTRPYETLFWTFDIDRTPPPAPVITAHPPDPALDHAAAFSFTDADPSVSFACRLDGGASTPCRSPQSYDALDSGDHRFCLKAVDPAGNASPETCFAWTIGALLDFSIAGSSLAGGSLYPGGPAVPVNLVFTNPNTVPITVTSVVVAITGTSATGCAASDFVVERQSTATPTLAPSSTASLVDLAVPQAEWPQVRMLDRGNQDGCQRARVALSFSGTAIG